MSIRKLSPGKYRVERDITINGQRYRPSRIIKTNLKGLQLKALQVNIEIELEEEVKLKASDVNKLLSLNLEGLMYWYFDHKSLEQRTKDWYKDYILTRPLKFFKDKTALQIKDSDAKSFFDLLDKEKSKQTGKPLSQKTKKHYHSALNSIFSSLVEEEIIDKNPFAKVKVKEGAADVKDRFYNLYEVKQHLSLLNQKASLQYFLMYVLTLLGGLRPAELRGLKWKNIDFEKQAIIIDESLTYTKEGFVEKGTKTNNSREIKFIPLIENLLKAQRSYEKQKHKSLKTGKPLSECYVITNDKGGHIGEPTFRKWWERFCKANDLRYIPPYGLRHTTATLLAYYKVPTVYIMDRMGHTCPMTTAKYTHAMEEGKEEVNEIMKESLNLPLVKIQ